MPGLPIGGAAFEAHTREPQGLARVARGGKGLVDLPDGVALDEGADGLVAAFGTSVEVREEGVGDAVQIAPE
ncbi:MAG: hypothetical protein ACK56I_31835, partial [bacterium]